MNFRTETEDSKRSNKMCDFPYTINDLRNACSNDRIKWSIHALKRLRERHITRDDYKNSIYTGEIIEYYPEDYRTPSCLVSSVNLNNKPLHTVSGYDDDIIYAVTAYYPNIEEWDNNFKTRRVSE